jgi:hypothetical protein
MDLPQGLSLRNKSFIRDRRLSFPLIPSHSRSSAVSPSIKSITVDMGVEAMQELYVSAINRGIATFHLDGKEIELKISGRSTWALRAKMPPCLLPTDYPADDELGMVTVLPHS